MNADRSSGRLKRALPWLWLAMSMSWAVVIFVTGAVAWPLAVWIATTVGPLTYLRTAALRSGLRASDTTGGDESERVEEEVSWP